ncbi:hypothetical protein BABINDRAFT_161055 [Babjeviella inositovora NRRL Y-12698]|uniref:Non-structural maintenance of chromosomes element 1 homolog n=1 Tax=Babjeviella inositovora NRRL Y-12698 TaxID=984486 RepID=A0A1E3QTH6_9ASCO|nr:uncharacterized protein BABINDRAFT_161055 [Babjeviella inositovora NRRL Y-12698]ODQ80854.1 hypothetical protein BABINDRAFT_161055 [Babjeviella inositovora NRRL Y-12698]
MQLPYGEIHHAVFQFLLTHKAIPESQLLHVLTRLYQTLFTAEHDAVNAESVYQDILDGVLESLNVKLIAHKLAFAIRKRRSQFDGKFVVMLVNTQADEATKMAIDHGEIEIAIFNAALDYIFNNEDGETSYAIGQTNLINIMKDKSAKYTATNAIELAAKFVQEGWLIETSKKKFTVTDLALCELHDSLIEKYGLASVSVREEDDDQPFSISICPACDQIVTMGRKCPGGVVPCHVKFHLNCARRYKIARGSACPNSSCSGVITDEVEPTDRIGLPQEDFRFTLYYQTE